MPAPNPNKKDPEPTSYYKRIVEDQQNKKPVIHTYYCKTAAMAILPVLNKLNADYTQDIKIDAVKLQTKPTTLFHKINQAWKWLVDHEDPDGKWWDLRKRVMVGRDRDAVYLRWKGVFKKQDLLAASESIPKSSDNDQSWKEKLHEFIDEAGEGETYEEKSTILSPGDIEYIRTMAIAVGDIAVIEVGKRGFKLIRSMELVKEMLAEGDDE